MDSTSISLPQPPRPFWETAFSLPPALSFGLACLISGIAVFLQQEILLTDTLYFNSLGEQMAYERIEELIARQQQYKWVPYAVVPVALVVQIFLITLCLNVGTILYEFKVGFRKLFGMVARSTVLIAVVGSLQIIPLLIVPIETLDQLTQLDWFSIAALFSGMDLPLWLLLPLKMLNLILLLTLLILAGGMHWLTGRPYGKMLGFVTGTYGVGMLLLVLLLVFLQLNMS
ncbi:MAG TPA: hypothetical protein VJ953_09380 [Saprospiraceae bacterium]|nr:hypothetical protein [Saprospiraceae bacterium]